jgi:hypothetical protein
MAHMSNTLVKQSSSSCNPLTSNSSNKALASYNLRGALVARTSLITEKSCLHYGTTGLYFKQNKLLEFTGMVLYE